MTIKVVKTPTPEELHECDLPYVSQFDSSRRRGKEEYPQGTLIECDICHTVFRSDFNGSYHHWEYRAWESFKARRRSGNKPKEPSKESTD